MRNLTKLKDGDICIGIKNRSNLTTNIKESNNINITKQDYREIIENNDIHFILVEKELYINNMSTSEMFLFTKFDFLNLKVSKGKTKNYLRIKLNEIDSYEIKYELLELEREAS